LSANINKAFLNVQYDWLNASISQCWQARPLFFLPTRAAKLQNMLKTERFKSCSNKQRVARCMRLVPFKQKLACGSTAVFTSYSAPQIIIKNLKVQNRLKE
jgi:plasmid rolling circle replication initiator protein Rep